MPTPIHAIQLVNSIVNVEGRGRLDVAGCRGSLTAANGCGWLASVLVVLGSGTIRITWWLLVVKVVEDCERAGQVWRGFSIPAPTHNSSAMAELRPARGCPTAPVPLDQTAEGCRFSSPLKLSTTVNNQQQLHSMRKYPILGALRSTGRERALGVEFGKCGHTYHGKWRATMGVKFASPQGASTPPTNTVFIALSSVCQFMLFESACPIVQWLGSGARTRPPFSTVPGQLLPVGVEGGGGLNVQNSLLLCAPCFL